MHQTREQFTHSSLLSLVRKELGQHYYDKSKRYDIPTVDCLASALALFSLKYPSLLQFDKDRTAEESALQHNLRTLYGVKKTPCDTQMRERLDGLGLKGIRASLKAIIGRLQRGKALEQWKVLNQYYLIPLDGTGFFSSSSVHCDYCCEKHHRNGDVTYSHQMLVGSIVHPRMRQVLPIGFEPIVKSDGQEIMVSGSKTQTLVLKKGRSIYTRFGGDLFFWLMVGLAVLGWREKQKQSGYSRI